MRWGWSIAVVIACAATPAAAQGDEPRFCPNRPSLEQSPCTIEPGHVMAEISLLDWTLDKQAGSREDKVLAGDVQVRLGVAPASELQLSWTAYGHDRLRDAATGLVDNSSGLGDVRVGFRQNLHHPDGKGFSIALEPYVTLPTGGHAIGAGTWGAGMVLPAAFDLSDAINLQFTGSLDAEPDEDRHGRHVSYSGDWGIGFALGEQFDLVTEIQVIGDEDPSGHTTQSTAAASLAFKPTTRLQIDALIGTGLNHDTPDLRVLTGGAILF